MDTPSTGESGALDTVQAGALLANILEPQAEVVEKRPEESPEPEKVEAEKPEDAEAVEVESADDAETIPVEIDGKIVELTKAQIADAYKNGLRQADYTKKTMEAAELRKAADAETNQARQERQQYAANLHRIASQLEGALSEQSQVDMQALLATDPVEYLKQQHLANDRQAKLQQVRWAQQQVHAKDQAEQAQQMHAFLQTQQEELLAKLPEWRDEAKGNAGRAELVNWLKQEKYPEQLLEIVNRSSHLILSARKAMLYDQMMSKAQAAAKKVQALPQKVERPGSGENTTLDKRGAAWQRFAKSGKVEDAGAIFSQFI